MYVTYYEKINRYMNLIKRFCVCLLLLYTEEQSYAGSRSVSLQWLLQFFFSMYKSNYTSTKTAARGPTITVLDLLFTFATSVVQVLLYQNWGEQKTFQTAGWSRQHFGEWLSGTENKFVRLECTDSTFSFKKNNQKNLLAHQESQPKHCFSIVLLNKSGLRSQTKHLDKTLFSKTRRK